MAISCIVNSGTGEKSGTMLAEVKWAADLNCQPSAVARLRRAKLVGKITANH